MEEAWGIIEDFLLGVKRVTLVSSFHSENSMGCPFQRDQSGRGT